MEENRDAGQVVVWGPGLESGKVRAGVPATFHVDATKADEAPLNVDVITEKGEVPSEGFARGLSEASASCDRCFKSLESSVGQAAAMGQICDLKKSSLNSSFNEMI